MRIYVQAIDYGSWKVISNGPYVPSKTVDNKIVPKDESEWTEADEAKVQLNAKAMNMLYCALDPNEFNRISTCETAKEIWDKLEITHEGTNQVKESKISMLVHHYELFKMKPDESISEMFTRFTDIINSLKSLGKIYTNVEMVRKILRSLPKGWEPKVTAIQEAKDLTRLSLDELLGSLMTHEITLKANEEEDSKKKKGIAFKSTFNDKSVDESSDEDDEDIAMITRKFKRYINKKKQGGRKFHKKETIKGDSSKKDIIICYECKKPGHIKPECPQLKKSYKKDKKNAMVAT